MQPEVKKPTELGNMIGNYENLKPEDLMDRTKAFEMFRKSYRRNEAMDENKTLLKEKFTMGKKLGQEVNTTRGKIKELTNKLDSLRKDNALRGMVDKDGEIIKTSEEDQLQSEINNAKGIYQSQYSELKELKGDIERIQTLLERSKERMKKDFEQWFEMMMKQYQVTNTDNKSSNTGISTAIVAKDKKVNESMSAFYKARDDIYQNIPKK